jgi:hypothetical protein
MDWDMRLPELCKLLHLVASGAQDGRQILLKRNKLHLILSNLHLDGEVLYSPRVLVRGGAPVKFLRVLAVAVLVLGTIGIVRADDTRVNMNGGPGGSPTCGSTTASADNAGLLNTDCQVAGTAITTFSFEVLDANTIGGGLTCASQLTKYDGWTGTLAAHNPGGVDVCTVTAPSTVSWQTYLNLLLLGDPYLGGPTLSTFHNDGDCDLDDFVLGIPVGCDIKIDNTTGGNSPFVADALTGLATNNNALPSLPEPGTLVLLLAGMSALPFLRRKLAR